MTDPATLLVIFGTRPEAIKLFPVVAALIALVAPLRERFEALVSARIDLHETTDTDASEFRPAKAAWKKLSPP